MTDLAVIILTKNEKLHIGRCLGELASLAARQIFVVDCFSTDGTQEIARQMGAIVVEHEWPGFYAKQFNWALDNLPIEASWVLRLDADEYLLPETIEEVKEVLPQYDGRKVTPSDLPSDVTSPFSRSCALTGNKDSFWWYCAYFYDSLLQVQDWTT